jgi:predicted metal-dependent peptidase
MNPTPADIVAAARMQVYSKHPYLSYALFALRPCPAPGLGTLAVDEGWRLYYDPDVVVAWQQEQSKKQHDGVSGVVFHELGHVLRQHFARRGDREPHRANRAQDREINDDVVQADWKLPGQPLMPKDIGMPDGLLFEDYYSREPETIFVKIMVPGCGGACGGAAGNPTQWEKDQGKDGEGSSAPDPVEAHEQQVILSRTALDIANHVKAHGRGTVPAGLQAWSQMRLTPAKIDWRKKLASLVRGALATAAGATDLTWQKPGRRSLHSAGRSGWPISPSMYRPIPKVGAVIDTSGSMSCKGKDGRTAEDEALSEIMGIAQAVGGEFWAVACDAQAYDVVRIGGQKDLDRLNKGNGGTDMRPGFEAIRKKKVDLVVIVTDGIVGDGWPSLEECRGTRVLAALVGDAEDVPPTHIPYVEAR